MNEGLFILGLQRRVKGSAHLSTEAIYQRVGHNTGNLAFHHAVDLHVGGATVVDWGQPPDEITAAGSLAVLPCANQLGEHLDCGVLARSLEQAQVAMVAVGLGAQSVSVNRIPELPQGTRAWVRAIADHAPSGAPNIAVRGEYTLKVLAHYGLADKAVVLGCPSHFINPDPALGSTIAANLREPKHVAVAAGHHSWKYLSVIEASLARIVATSDGAYVAQSGLETLRMIRGDTAQLEPAQAQQVRDSLFPDMSLEAFEAWIVRHGRVFFDVDAWMEHYRKYDFVIGARIHGIMLALQAGVPALCIVHDSRMLELCRTMAIPHVLGGDIADGIGRDDLLPLFERFDPDVFDATRRSLGRDMVNFYEGNGISSPQWLTDIGMKQARIQIEEPS